MPYTLLGRPTSIHAAIIVRAHKNPQLKATSLSFSLFKVLLIIFDNNPLFDKNSLIKNRFEINKFDYSEDILLELLVI